MKNKLSVTLVQSDIVWENKHVNISNLEQTISTLSQTDLIVLPEMFSTGFSMDVENCAEPMNGLVVNWMKTMASQFRTSIVGSLMVEENKLIFNRMLFISPGGNVSFYDKRHLFRMGEENAHFTPGNKRKIVTYDNWRCNLLVCYDLRFPVWSRNKSDYDLLIYCANWPESRREVWLKLLLARAIENQCYVAAVNRIGKDGKGLNHSGDSVLIDPKGNIIVQAKKNDSCTISADMDYLQLEKFRSDFPAWMDADNFEIDPQNI